MRRKREVLLVGKGGFADVAAALRSARPGDVVELSPGEYDGEVVVDVPIELRPKMGRGTVTLSAGTGNTLMLLADVTVRDLTIVGRAWGAAAVEVAGPVAPRIVDCEVRAPGHTGIRVRSGARPEVSSCRIGPALHGLRVESAGGEYRRCEFTDTALESVIAAAGAEPRVADSRFVRQGGHAAVAVGQETVLSLHGNDFEGGPVASIRASDGGRIVVTDATFHDGGGPALEVDDDGVLHANRIRIAGTGSEGVLVSGGEGRFTACRFTGTHGPAVWMTGGRARFEDCEAIDADRAGFLVVGGVAEFVRCVAHNNAGQGFSLLSEVTLTECSSFGNGQPDDVGQRRLEPVGAAVDAVGPRAVIEIAPGEHEEGSNKPVELRAAGKPNRKRALPQNSGRLVRVGNVQALKQAIEKAVAGDVIEIAPGNYRRVDGLRIQREVEVRAAEGPGTVQLAVSRPIVVSAAATLRDVRIIANFVPGLIVRKEGSAVLVEHCEIISNEGATVEIADGASPTFRECEIKFAQRGVVLRAAGGRYEQCRLIGGAEPVMVVRSTGAVFLNCEIRSGRNGSARVEVDGSRAGLVVGSDGLLSGSVQYGDSATVRLVK